MSQLRSTRLPVIPVVQPGLPVLVALGLLLLIAPASAATAFAIVGAPAQIDLGQTIALSLNCSLSVAATTPGTSLVTALGLLALGSVALRARRGRFLLGVLLAVAAQGEAPSLAQSCGEAAVWSVTGPGTNETFGGNSLNYAPTQAGRYTITATLDGASQTVVIVVVPVQFYEEFADGDYTAAPPWDVQSFQSSALLSVSSEALRVAGDPTHFGTFVMSTRIVATPSVELAFEFRQLKPSGGCLAFFATSGTPDGGYVGGCGGYPLTNGPGQIVTLRSDSVSLSNLSPHAFVSRNVNPLRNYFDGTWHRVRMTRTASGTLSVFIDERLALQAGSAAQAVNRIGFFLSIGGSASGDELLIDNVRAGPTVACPLGYMADGNGACVVSPASFVPVTQLETITGMSADGSILTGTAGLEAWRWSASGSTLLGTTSDVWYVTQSEAMSADGSLIVGAARGSWPRTSYLEPFRWSEQSGIVPLQATVASNSFARAVNADGSAIVGDLDGTAFRWTAAGGSVLLGTLPGDPGSGAEGVNADGSVVVGWSGTSNERDAFRWTAATGMQALGQLAGATENYAVGVSASGQEVAVTGRAGNGYYRAMRWTQAMGLTDLLVREGTAFWYNLYARAISGDGSTVVGIEEGTTRRAFVWTAVHGIRSLSDIVGASGVDITGWSIDDAAATSSDGRTIAGSALDPSGTRRGFVAVIP